LSRLNDGAGAVANSTSTASRWLTRYGLPRHLILAIICCSLLSSPAFAAANNQVRITGLTDLAFGSITNLGVDHILSESVCVYAKAKPSDLYDVTANGSGAGGAFTLSSGSATLAYDVQWSASPNQSTGAQLTANQALTGQANSASNDDCSSGQPTTASLIVILRSAALGAARVGSYSGTLSLIVAPE
jgi:hypothetical protein